RTESPIVSPTAAARRAAAPPRPAASRRPAVAGHSRPRRLPPSRRLWRLRVGRWGWRFWGGQLAHPAHNTLGLEPLKRGLDGLLDVTAHVAYRFVQRLASLVVQL